MNIVPLDLASDMDLMSHTAQDKKLINILKQKNEKKKGEFFLLFFGRPIANEAPPIGLILSMLPKVL